MHGFLEFLGIESLVAVVISNLEFLSNTRNTSSSSSGNLGLDMLQDLSLIGVGSKTWFSSGCFWLWSSENVVILCSSWFATSS
jgi:hypothetical protein